MQRFYVISRNAGLEEKLIALGKRIKKIEGQIKKSEEVRKRQDASKQETKNIKKFKQQMTRQ